MTAPLIRPDRRLFLGALPLPFFTRPGLFAEELVRTPRQTEGPFYPDRLPLDTDNDLLVINDSITPAVGTVTHLSGKVLDARGDPIRNAVVEIWQVDSRGAYLHSKTDNAGRRDRNFQGFGRFTTASNGEYYFRTVKPVRYPGRTPHIHYKIKKGGRTLLVTQLYIRGEAQNDKDGIYRSIRDQKQRDAVTVDFAPMKDSRIGEVTAKFDLVLGTTPDEKDDKEKEKKGPPKEKKGPPREKKE